MEPFEKITRRALYEEIADKLEGLILNDTAHLPEKLPSEQFLSNSFGVSRPVIREALKILKDRGLIDSRQGASSVITGYAPEHFIKSVNRIVCAKNVSPEQIYEVRAPLEILAARLAAQSSDPETVETLRACNRRLMACDEGSDAQARLDLTFHKTVADRSGNPLLAFLVDAMSELLLPVIAQSLQPSTHADGVRMHDRIISAIAAGDEETAGDLMRNHVILSIRNFESFRPAAHKDENTPEIRPETEAD